MDKIRSFINNFRLKEDDEEPYYMTRLNEIRQSEIYNLNIDCEHLLLFSRNTKKLYDQLVRYPQEIVPLFDLVVFQEFNNTRRGLDNNDPDDLEGDNNIRIQVRTFNLKEHSRMRNLNPSDVDQLVAIRGMVIRTSNLIPDLKMAFFRCNACNNSKEVMMDRGRIDHPEICDRCNNRKQFDIVHNRSIFANRQLIKMQESAETVQAGECPHTITLHAFDDLVDICKPGDRVEITGIYRAHPMRVNPKQRILRSVYKTYIDVLHIRKTEGDRFFIFSRF